MILYRGCPHCWQARDRELSEFTQVGRDLRLPAGKAATPCPDCGAPLLLSMQFDPHFVIQCPACRHIYEACDGWPYIGGQPVCPKCKTAPGRTDKPDWMK
jgi:phage FluMu protein Com